jgi:uroporphyrinogen decarboxylase
MRQAGRYLPEYRQLRDRAGSFLALCYDPDLAAEVTLQPVRRYDLDAAILFADILVVPHAMGLPLRFTEGEGPVLGTVRQMREVDVLRSVGETQEVGNVCQTVAAVRRQLPAECALIGFCGGVWTVASYMVEGGSSDRLLARVAAYQREPWFLRLIERVTAASIEYLTAQIAAGAQVVQIFDSWAGDLVGSEFEEFVVEPTAAVVRGVREIAGDIPVIVFARGAGTYHRTIAGLPGVSAVGVETETDLSVLGEGVVVQGNLDPIALLAGEVVAVREARRVCKAMPRHRHVFNLGHGIKVGTNPEVVGSVVRAVRDFDG